VTETAAINETPGVPPMGLAARVVNVFLAPRAAYTAVAARPRALGVLLLAIVIIAAAQFVFLSTEAGRAATMDQQLSAVRAFGVTVTDQMVQQMQSRMAYARYTSSISIAVILPIIAAVMAGLVLMIFTAIMGGGATYKQVFAVVAHSQMIGVLQQLFTLPIAYARQEIVSPTRLAVFFPMLSDQGFLYYLLSAIDLFYLWSFVNLAIGIAVLYKRRTGPVAGVLLGLYALFAVLYAAWRAF
jgi:hypothetical protein